MSDRITYSDWTRPIIYAGSLVEFALEYGKQF